MLAAVNYYLSAHLFEFSAATRVSGVCALCPLAAVAGAVERLEGQVRVLEGQLAEVRGALQQLLELNSGMRDMLMRAGQAQGQAQGQGV